MNSDRVRNLVYYAAALGGYALLGVALVLAIALVLKRGRDEPPAHSDHLAWIGHSLEKAAAERRKDPSPQLDYFVDRYLEDPRVLICPSVRVKFNEDYWPVDYSRARGGPDERDLAYCYVSGLSETDGHDCVIAFDEEWNHGLGPEGGGVNVLYTGGHVEWKDDPGSFQVEATAQLLDMQRRGARSSIRRPWWSRYPEPPAFAVPPPRGRDRSFLMRASTLSLVIGAAAALVGVYLLRRIAL